MGRTTQSTSQGTSRTAKAVAVCLALVVAGALPLLSGCSEKETFTPTIVDGLKTDGLFRSDTLYTSDDQALETAASSGARAGYPKSSRKLVVCNWRGRAARCHLWFSELPESTVTVIRADLFLYATRIQSIPSDAQYEIYALTDTLEDDSLRWSDLDAVLGPKVADFSLEADPSGTIASDSVVLDVTSLVASWVGRETDNCGIAVRLADETASEAIAEFASREDATTRTNDNDTTFYVRPALRIRYVAATSLAARELAFAAADTSYALALCTQDTFVDSLLVPLSDTLLVCSNGFPSRTYLKFDLSEIPVEASVIKSTLRLVPDLTASSFDALTISCHALVDTFSDFETEYGVKGAGTTALTYDSLDATSSIDMNITALVQNVVSGLVKDYGFVIRTSDETADLDFIVFTSTRDGDPDRAPRLEIEYVLPPLPSYRRD